LKLLSVLHRLECGKSLLTQERGLKLGHPI